MERPARDKLSSMLLTYVNYGYKKPGSNTLKIGQISWQFLPPERNIWLNNIWLNNIWLNNIWLNNIWLTDIWPTDIWPTQPRPHHSLEVSF
jgi:hypothetical protein